MKFYSLMTYAAMTLTQALFAETAAAPQAPFVFMTIPKAGSHLGIKALHLMTGGSISIWHTRFPSPFMISPERGFLYTHLCISPELLEDYERLPRLKKIIMIRDLRDVAVSIVSQIKKVPWPGMSYETRQHFLKSSFDEQLLFVLNYEFDVEEIASIAPNSLQVSLVKIAEQSYDFYQDEEVFTCRYENLVGAEGGGSEEAQKLELHKMASFLGIYCSDEKIDEIAAQLYGNEFDPFGKQGFKNFGSTFNKGKIGSWKTLFNEEHKRVFKDRLGPYLIALGYETDDTW